MHDLETAELLRLRVLAHRFEPERAAIMLDEVDEVITILLRRQMKLVIAVRFSCDLFERVVEAGHLERRPPQHLDGELDKLGPMRSNLKPQIGLKAVEGGGEREMVVVDNLRSKVERLSGDAGRPLVGEVLSVRRKRWRRSGGNGGNLGRVVVVTKAGVGAGGEKLSREIRRNLVVGHNGGHLHKLACFKAYNCCSTAAAKTSSAVDDVIQSDVCNLMNPSLILISYVPKKET